MGRYDEDAKMYRMIYDIHTHTTFSHGKGSIEDNVKSACQKGLSTIGIADHGPGHLFYGIKKNDILKMRKEIRRLQPMYPDIEIILGVEANIINPSGSLDVATKESEGLDYILAGYHYGILGEKPINATKIHLLNLISEKVGGNWKKLRQKNTELVVKALYTNEIKVLTHPGDKGPFDLNSIAAACVKTSTMMEISTWHEAPLDDELKMLSATDVRFIISSDAHTPQRVGTFVPGLKRALKAGIDPARIDNLKEA